MPGERLQRGLDTLVWTWYASNDTEGHLHEVRTEEGGTLMGNEVDMRVDEYVKFIARRPSAEAAREAAKTLAAAFPGAARVTQVHYLAGPDSYGTFTYEVTICPAVEDL